MMVGNNNILSCPLCLGYLFTASDAAIHGDYQANALVTELFQRGDSQPVSLGLAVGYIRDGLPAEDCQSQDERGGGGNAVGVEIAVNADGLAGKQSAGDAVSRRLHIGEQEGVAEEAPVAGQEGAEVLGAGNAAVITELNQQTCLWDSPRLSSVRTQP